MPLMAEMFGTGLTGTGSHPYCLFIDGLDVIKQPGTAGSIFGTQIDSVRLKERIGSAPTLTFQIDDPGNVLSFAQGADVYFCDHRGMQVNSTFITSDLFRGTISSRKIVTRDGTLFKRWEVEATGLEELLSRRVIPSLVFRSGADLFACIQVVLAYYGDPRISSLQADATALYANASNGPGYLIGETSVVTTITSDVSVSGKTTKEAIRALVAASNRSAYYAAYQDRFVTEVTVDSQGRAMVALATLPILSQNFDQGATALATKPAMSNLEVEEDRSRLINAVYVSGVDAASSGWVVDATSIALYGRYEAILDAPKAVSSTTRDAIGQAYLNGHVVTRRIAFDASSSHDSFLKNFVSASDRNGYHVRHFGILHSDAAYFADTSTAVLGEMTEQWEGGGTSLRFHFTFQTQERSLGSLIAQQTADALQTSTAANRLEGGLGEVAVRVKAGTPADTDFDVARDGFIVVDTTRATMWLRAGGTWHDVAGSTPKVCIASRTTVQAIGTGAWTALQFNATDISDPFAFHDPASNNTRFTVPAGWAGTYLCVGQSGFASGSAIVTRYIGWSLNGGDPADMDSTGGLVTTAALVVRLQSVALLELAVGDYVELEVFQDSGGNLNTLGASKGTLYFLGELA